MRERERERERERKRERERDIYIYICIYTYMYTQMCTEIKLRPHIIGESGARAFFSRRTTAPPSFLARFFFCRFVPNSRPRANGLDRSGV